MTTDDLQSLSDSILKISVILEGKNSEKVTQTLEAMNRFISELELDKSGENSSNDLKVNDILLQAISGVQKKMAHSF